MNFDSKLFGDLGPGMVSGTNFYFGNNSSILNWNNIFRANTRVGKPLQDSLKMPWWSRNSGKKLGPREIKFDNSGGILWFRKMTQKFLVVNHNIAGASV